MEDALWTQGIRKKSHLKKRRYEFQTDHGFRKWFKTRCEMSGMKSINIEILMGHSIGTSDSYYKIPEDELSSQYINALYFLILNRKNLLKKEVDTIRAQNQKDYKFLEKKLNKKEKENVECLALVILIQLDQKWSMPL